MWILRSQKSGTSYHLFVGQTYSVGRKDADILIENDPSISRKHATLTVTHLEGNLNDPSKVPTLNVQDIGSKYGTSRNDDRVKGEETLVDGDNVKFGQFESVFSVCYVPFVFTTSCIDSTVKKELKKAVHQLGGHLVSEWKPECTHLVMSDIKITIKAVCCLISQKPLVSPEYVSDLVKNISSGLPEPVPNKYIPPIGEAIIDKETVNFDVVPERKRIFENKTFNFLDKNQFKKMRHAVMLGGGTVTYISPDSPVDPVNFLKIGVCIVQPQIQDTSLSTCQLQIIDLLQRNNKRMIQESDFGLAVAYCSTEMFCNPDYNIGTSQFGVSRLYSQTLTQQEACMRNASGNNSFRKKPNSSFPVEKMAAVNQSASVQDISNCSNSGKKRKTRNSSNDMEAVPKCSKQTKLENFVTISSSKSSCQEKAADSISIEGIALCAPSVKEEPESADEMEVDDNSVFVDSPDTVKQSTPSTVELKSPIESSLNHSTINILKNVKKHKPVQSSRVSRSEQSGFLSSKNAMSNHSVDEDDDENENVPRNLIQVEFADLVCVKPRRTNILKNNNSSIHAKNFKKFRKILPLGARLLPKIIGGHELEPFSKNASKALDDILNDSSDVQPSHNLDDNDSGEFDWESQPRQKKR